MNAGPVKWWKVCAVPLSATALVAAPLASADPGDDAFIGVLSNYGINTDNRDTVIAHGHGVCAALDKGQDSSVIALKLMNDPKLDISSRREAGFFVGASVAAYCPQYRGSVDPSVIWLLPFPPMM